MVGLSLSTLQNRIERLENANRFASMQNVEILPNYEFKIFYEDEGKFKYNHYKPNKTALKFHASDLFVRAVMGPFGSGKSTKMMADILLRACAMPPCNDGVRRIKIALIRNTSGELYTSTLETWKTWFGNLGRVRPRQKPVLTYEHIFSDGHGRIEMTALFIALDREDDLKKLKSTEFTLAYLNEASELPHGLLNVIKGRVNGRYPSKSICPRPYFTGVLLDYNPPDDEHYLFKLFENDCPDSYILFKQPSGLLEDEKGEPVKDSRGRYIQNPDCDNHENLNADYYSKMAEGAELEFIKVFCMGKYGVLKNGEAVYSNYNDDIHAVEDIEIDKKEPIYVGFDFGSTPACMIEQYVGGQLRSIKEFISEFNTDMKTFAETQVIPYLNQHCQGMKIFASHDPSDPRGQGIAISPSQVLRDLGIVSEPASSNDLQPRIDAVKFFMNRLVNGKPAYIVSKKGCKTLRKGYLSKYQFRLVHVYGELTPKEEPIKSHPISDIQDAHQYVALRIHREMSIPKVDKSKLLRPAYVSGFAL
jgi:hypothetical protein